MTKDQLLAIDRYKFCNHHHELDDSHEVVEMGGCKFIANKAAIPLLKALNDAGLKTRTHHYEGGKHGFVSILLDNVTIEVKTVMEKDSSRTRYNGKKELLIIWENE